MKTRKKRPVKDDVWIAVKVWRGFPDEIKAFRTEKAALQQEKVWRKQMNQDYDETGVFQIEEINAD